MYFSRTINFLWETFLKSKGKLIVKVYLLSIYVLLKIWKSWHSLGRSVHLYSSSTHSGLGDPSLDYKCPEDIVRARQYPEDRSDPWCRCWRLIPSLASGCRSLVCSNNQHHMVLLVQQVQFDYSTYHQSRFDIPRRQYGVWCY